MTVSEYKAVLDELPADMELRVLADTEELPEREYERCSALWGAVEWWRRVK